MKIIINGCRQFCTEVALDTGEIEWDTLDLYNVVIDNYINCLMTKEEIMYHATNGVVIKDPNCIIEEFKDIPATLQIDVHDCNYQIYDVGEFYRGFRELEYKKDWGGHYILEKNERYIINDIKRAVPIGEDIEEFNNKTTLSKQIKFVEKILDNLEVGLQSYQVLLDKDEHFDISTYRKEYYYEEILRIYKSWAGILDQLHSLN